MSNIPLPRLLINALCTTCGELFPEVGSLTLVRQALAHSAQTAHVIVLNGTVDVSEDEYPAIASAAEALDDIPRSSDPQEAPTTLELLEQYWKAGCQCRIDSAELCALCKSTEAVLVCGNRL